MSRAGKMLYPQLLLHLVPSDSLVFAYQRCKMASTHISGLIRGANFPTHLMKKAFHDLTPASQFGFLTALCPDHTTHLQAFACAVPSMKCSSPQPPAPSSLLHSPGASTGSGLAWQVGRLWLKKTRRSQIDLGSNPSAAASSILWSWESYFSFSELQVFLLSEMEMVMVCVVSMR